MIENGHWILPPAYCSNNSLPYSPVAHLDKQETLSSFLQHLHMKRDRLSIGITCTHPALQE